MKVGLLVVMVASLFCRLNILATFICAALALPFRSWSLLEWAAICALSAVIWWIIGITGSSFQPKEPPLPDSTGTSPPTERRLP
jgi:uncharacterized membrane protein